MATERLILRVTLRDVHPRVGRRIAVAEDLTLAQLHRVIQEAFDGEDYHLHEFDIEGLKFGRPDYDEGAFYAESPMRDERKCMHASAVGSHRTLTYRVDAIGLHQRLRQWSRIHAANVASSISSAATESMISTQA